MDAQSCKTCRHWNEFDDAPCFERCKKYGGGTSDWFGEKCEGYEASMTADEILAELRKLSARWRAAAAKEQRNFYVEDAAGVWLVECAERLDAIIEKASTQ